MSAWIVSRQHIDVMVDAAIRSGLVEASQADEVGRMLWKENLVSVAYRYPRDKDGKRPGPTDFRDADVDTYTFTPLPKEIVDVWNLNPDAALAKTVGCYEYQSCEHPGWRDSPACALSSRLCELVREHDGYGDCIPWGWEVPLECQPKVDQAALRPEDMKVESFIERARTSVAYDEDAKREFHRQGEVVLKQLAAALGYGPDHYDLRHNQGGIAVSGEITLHSDRLYVQLSQSPLGQNRGFLWRTCEGRKDYTGGPNRSAKWEELRDLPRLARTMHEALEMRENVNAAPKPTAAKPAEATAEQTVEKPANEPSQGPPETTAVEQVPGDTRGEAMPTNRERAERFAGLLPYYPDTDEHSNAIDLLADCQHWCREQGHDFEELLRIARMHCETERWEEHSLTPHKQEDASLWGPSGQNAEATAKPKQATELKAPTPDERVNAKLVGELADTLDYLLEQTVDMDLRYGIGLSEGEEDARAKALAAISKARGETAAVEQAPGGARGEPASTDPGGVKAAEGTAAAEVVEGRHFRATLYDNQSTPGMHSHEVLLTRKDHPRDTLLIDSDRDQPCELVEVVARLAASRGNWDEGPREWVSSTGTFKVDIDPALHRLAQVHFYERTPGEPEPRWVPVYGLDEAEDLLAVAKGVAALHTRLNTPGRDFDPESTHVGTVERGRFRLDIYEDRTAFEPIYRATLYADGKATWPLDYESRYRCLRERLSEEGNDRLSNYLEARSLPPAGDNDLSDLLKTLEDGEQLMVSLSRQAEQERDNRRKAAAATTENPSCSEITNDRAGEKPETPGLKQPSGNERNDDMAEYQNEKNGQSTKRQEGGKNKPLHKETHGAVQVTIWDNGPDREPTVNFGRLYRSSGGWKVAQSFQAKHLSDLMKATEAAALALGQEVQRPPQSLNVEKPQEICSIDSGRLSAVFSVEWSGTTGTLAYGAKILCDGKELFAPMPGPMLGGLQVVAKDGGLPWLADQVAKRNLPEPDQKDFQHFEKTLQASQALMGRFMESGHKKVLADKNAVQELGLDVSGVPEQEHETTHDMSR